MSKYTITVYGLRNERSLFICAINRGEECIRQISLITMQLHVSVDVKFTAVFTKPFNLLTPEFYI
jgi:hypothetical protein